LKQDNERQIPKCLPLIKNGRALQMKFAIVNWISILIGFLAFFQFANTLNYGYVWDDVIVVEKNEKIKNGLNNISVLWQRNKSNELSDQYGFRPIPLMSYALEVALWGLRPQRSHLINVLLYATLCIIMYHALNWVVDNRFLSLLSTVFFMVHPLHSEVVANIKSRDEILALLFAMLAVTVMLKYVNVSYITALFATSAFFFLGLLSKESNVIFAIIIPVALIWFSKLPISKILITALTLSLIAASIIPGTMLFKALLVPAVLLFCSLLYGLYQLMNSPNTPFSKYLPLSLGLLFGVLIGGYAWYATNYLPFLTSEQIAAAPINIIADDAEGLYLEDKVLGNALFGLPSGSYIQISANSFLILGEYLKGFLFPFSQCYYYGFNHIPLAYWNNWEVLFAAFLHIVLFAGAIYLIPRFKELSFALIFYLVAIAPYTQLAKVLDDFMADRFMFVPSLALCLAVALILWRYGKLVHFFELVKTKHGAKNSAGITAYISIVFLLFVLPSFSYQTYSRNKVWQDNFTLVSSDLPKLQNSSRAHYYYANECFNKYLTEKNAQQRLIWQNKVIEHYSISKSIHKSAYFAYVGLVKAYMTFYQSDKAIAVLNEMLRLYPHLALTHYYMGHYHFRLQDYEAAIPHLEKAHQMRPKLRETISDLAWSYHNVGRTDEAIQALKNTILLIPDFMSSYGNLSAIYYEIGDFDNATRTLEQALTIDPFGEPIYDMLIYQHQQQGNTETAQKYLKEAQQKGLLKNR